MQSPEAIVFIHWGAAEHLASVVETAVINNPTNRVILLSDIALDLRYGNFSFIDIRDFESQLEDFKKVFINFSSNSAAYEYMCFARWIVLKGLCEKLGLRVVYHSDSDVLIYDDLSRVAQRIPNFDFSLSHGCCGHSSYWTKRALDQFSEYIINIYRSELVRLEDWYKKFQMPGRPGGYSDMKALEEFSKLSNLSFFEMTSVIENRTFDHNINMTENGFVSYCMVDGTKAIYWIDNAPFGKVAKTGELIRFSSMHMQGEAKSSIEDVVRRYRPIYAG